MPINKKGKRMYILYVRDVPEGVQTQFKAHCAARGESMSAVIRKFMRETIKGVPKRDVQGNPRSV